MGRVSQQPISSHTYHSITYKMQRKPIFFFQITYSLNLSGCVSDLAIAERVCVSVFSFSTKTQKRERDREKERRSERKNNQQEKQTNCIHCNELCVKYGNSAARAYMILTTFRHSHDITISFLNSIYINGRAHTHTHLFDSRTRSRSCTNYIFTLFCFFLNMIIIVVFVASCSTF